MEHAWSILCQFTITDGQRNNVSLIEVIEQFRFSMQPLSGVGEIIENLIPLQVEFVSLWYRTNGEKPELGNVRLDFLSPEGEVLEEIKYVVDLTQHQRSRFTGKIEGLPYKGNGQYMFTMHIEKGQKESMVVAQVPLMIHRDNPL